MVIARSTLALSHFYLVHFHFLLPPSTFYLLPSTFYLPPTTSAPTPIVLPSPTSPSEFLFHGLNIFDRVRD